MISADDLHLYSITDNYREATEEIRKYYRVFHSLRYVGRNLVLRLNYELSESLLTTINQDFSDLLNGGKYQQQGKLEEEKDDERTDDLPRLVFYFKRRGHGRLRQLINLINEQGTPAEPESR